MEGYVEEGGEGRGTMGREEVGGLQSGQGAERGGRRGRTGKSKQGEELADLRRHRERGREEGQVDRGPKKEWRGVPTQQGEEKEIFGSTMPSVGSSVPPSDPFQTWTAVHSIASGLPFRPCTGAASSSSRFESSSVSLLRRMLFAEQARLLLARPRRARRRVSIHVFLSPPQKTRAAPFPPQGTDDMERCSGTCTAACDLSPGKLLPSFVATFLTCLPPFVFFFPNSVPGRYT